MNSNAVHSVAAARVAAWPAAALACCPCVWPSAVLCILLCGTAVSPAPFANRLCRSDHPGAGSGGRRGPGSGAAGKVLRCEGGCGGPRPLQGDNVERGEKRGLRSCPCLRKVVCVLLSSHAVGCYLPCRAVVRSTLPVLCIFSTGRCLFKQHTSERTSCIYVLRCTASDTAAAWYCLQAGADEVINMEHHKPEQLKGLMRHCAPQGRCPTAGGVSLTAAQATAGHRDPLLPGVLRAGLAPIHSLCLCLCLSQSCECAPVLAQGNSHNLLRNCSLPSLRPVPTARRGLRV